MKLFFITLVLVFVNVFSSPVFADESFIWNPDTLPSKKLGESQLITVTVSNPLPNNSYRLSASGEFGNIAESPNTGSNPPLTITISGIFMPYFSGTKMVIVSRYSNLNGLYNLSTRTTDIINDSNLPDVRPTSFDICYRPISNTDTHVEFPIFISDENLGPSLSPSHHAFASINADLSCQSGSYPSIKEIFDIPALNAGQHFATSRLSRPGWMLSCVQKGVSASFNVNKNLGNFQIPDIFERNYSNNSVFRTVQPCPVVSCAASISSSKTIVTMGESVNLQGKIVNVSGGDISGYDFRWVSKNSSAKFLYPPTVNPVKTGVWYPGSLNTTGLTAGSSTVILQAKNKKQAWNQAVNCTNGLSISVK